MGFNRFERDLDRCEILADKIGLEQVIANILENALKYSTENIEIKLKEDTLSIKDYGFGISENELLNIYQRYYQSNSSIKGQGIGLAIVKKYCDENDIKLKIVSKKGAGTTVFLYFQKTVVKQKKHQ